MGLMREKAKRLQNVMLHKLNKFAFVLNHDERSALAEGVGLIGEMVDELDTLEKAVNDGVELLGEMSEKLDNLERAVNGKNHNQQM